MSGPFSHLLLASGQQLNILLFLLQHLHFAIKTCSTFGTLDHTTNQLLVLELLLLLLILLLHLMQLIVTSLHCLLPFWVEPHFFTLSSRQLTDPPTVVCVQSAFRFDFPCHTCHSSHPLLLPHLFLFCFAFLHVFASL